MCVEKDMATHFNILAWKIPLTEEPSRLQSMGSWCVTSLQFNVSTPEGSLLFLNGTGISSDVRYSPNPHPGSLGEKKVAFVVGKAHPLLF